MSKPVPEIRRVRCANLAEVRANIDRLDRQIVPLLAERGAYVLDAARHKTDIAEVSAPARVEEVIAKVRQLALDSGGLPDVVEAAYRALIAAFIAAERVEHERLAREGE